ncbi:hypothetical protein PQQ96_19435, partial [Paraburkholderia sediminicola]|uniref:hypothetical protein n=1 Tax=Paraburkholderia sediminicola TaxID=458836 RepID=UPI0038B7B780
ANGSFLGFFGRLYRRVKQSPRLVPPRLDIKDAPEIADRHIAAVERHYAPAKRRLLDPLIPLPNASKGNSANTIEYVPLSPIRPFR